MGYVVMIEREMQGAAAVDGFGEILNILFRGALRPVSRSVDSLTSFWALEVDFRFEWEEWYSKFFVYAIHDAEGIDAPITRAEEMILGEMDRRWIPTAALDTPTFTWTRSRTAY